MTMHPTWLFHKSLEAKVFENEAEYKAALADGWQDTPVEVISNEEAAKLLEASEAEITEEAIIEETEHKQETKKAKGKK